MEEWKVICLFLSGICFGWTMGVMMYYEPKNDNEDED